MSHSRTFLDEKLSRLRSLEEDPIVLFDIGSRNCVWELENLASKVATYGFEPNPAEFLKLKSGTTDVERDSKRQPPAYKAIRYFPLALSSRKGRSTLNLTRGPGAASLLRPNLPCMERFDIADRFQVMEEIDVETDTLENVCRCEGIASIDFLKMDTQGSEGDILAASESMIRRTSVVKTEVEFVSMYEGQKLFADIDILLRDFGFELLTLEFDRVHHRTKVFPKSPRGQLLWADAYYVNRMVQGEASLVKMVLVLFELGFLDEGLFILEKKVPAWKQDLAEVVDFYKRDRRPFKARAASTLLGIF